MRCVGKVCVLLASFCAVILPPVATSGRIAADARQSYNDRLIRLRSVVVTFRQESIDTPPADVLKSAHELAAQTGRNIVFNTGSFVEQGEFSFLDGMASYDVSYAPETVKRFDAEKRVFLRRNVQVFSGDRAESLVDHSRSGNLLGAIFEHKNLPDDYPVDVALGLRDGPESRFFDAASLKDAAFAATSDGHLIMQMRSSRRNDITYKWELDPALADAVLRFQAKKDDFVFYDLTCSELDTKSGLGLPGHIRVVQPAKTTTVSNLKYTLDSRDNTAARYRLQYPSGSHIRDTRLDVAIAAPTTRSFSDRDIFLAAVARDSRSRPVPTRSALTKWWIIAGAVLCMTLLWYGYQRVQGRKTAVRRM